MKNLKDYNWAIEDLWLAEELIERNKELLIKYPSLEDSLKLLKKVIALEQLEEPCQSD